MSNGSRLTSLTTRCRAQTWVRREPAVELLEAFERAFLRPLHRSRGMRARSSPPDLVRGGLGGCQDGHVFPLGWRPAGDVPQLAARAEDD